MRIIFIVLIFLEISVLANINSVEKFYNAGEYKKAIEYAKNSTKNYSNPRLHMLWARSAQKLGNTDEAMSAYERVVILQDNNIEARMSLVKIYKDTDRTKLSSEMSMELREFRLTPEQEASLDLIQSTNVQTFKTQASLSVGYDTNININPGSVALDNFYSITGSIGELSTIFSRFVGGVSYINDFSETGGWNVGGDLKIYYQNNFDQSHYNLFLGSVAVNTGYIGNAFTINIPVSYDRINYLEKDLVQQFTSNPRVNIKLNNRLTFNLGLIYTKRVYIDQVNKSKNDMTVGNVFGLYYFLNDGFVYANIKYVDYLADEKIYAKFVNKNMITTSLGVSYKPLQWLTSRFDYRYRSASYGDNIGTTTNLDSTKRNDTYHQIEVKLSHYFLDNYELYISDRYEKNISNYVPVEYSKNVVMLGLGLKY